MPNNYPYDRWYWNDWVASTAILSATARGVWISLLAHMYLNDRTYFFVGTEAELARISGCDVDTVRCSVHELHRHKIADVTFRYENVTDLLRIECRRYKKAYSERKRVSDAMKKLRDTRKSDADVTSTRARNHYPITSNQEKVSTGVDTKENPAYPSSVDEVLEIAHSPQCGVAMTRESAELYLATRLSSDWVDAAGREIAVGNLIWDIKKWSLKDRREQPKPQDQKTRATEPGRENEGRDEIGF